MTERFAELDARTAAVGIERYRVIDVREPDEFDGPLGHVPGSELLPLSRVAASAELLAGRPLLIVCRSGNRSSKACGALIERGVTDVTNLAGGMIAWNEAGLPVERERSA